MNNQVTPAKQAGPKEAIRDIVFTTIARLSDEAQGLYNGNENERLTLAAVVALNVYLSEAQLKISMIAERFMREGDRDAHDLAADARRFERIKSIVDGKDTPF